MKQKKSGTPPGVPSGCLLTEITSHDHLDQTPLDLSNIEHIQRKILGMSKRERTPSRPLRYPTAMPAAGKRVTMVSEVKFPHRHNSDGSYDSICTACSVTVASVRGEELLRAHELAHVCDPVNLYRIAQARGSTRPMLVE